MLGLVGMLLNSFLLHSFYKERFILATAVNVLIYSDLVYKLLYSALIVLWRNYNLINGTPWFTFWLGIEEVRVAFTKCNSLFVTKCYYCQAQPKPKLQLSWADTALISSHTPTPDKPWHGPTGNGRT